MSETIKIEIEIPAPPEGWGEVKYGYARPGDYALMLTIWEYVNVQLVCRHVVARKLPPLWTPSPELVAALKPGWLTRDSFDIVALHLAKPKHDASHWVSEGPEWRLNAVNPDLLPPLTISWERCCFQIGEPKE